MNKLFYKTFKDKNKINKILTQISQNTNNSRFSIKQFQKYLSLNNILWKAICNENDEIFALACLEYKKENNLNICYLAEIQTIIKGYGKKLLQCIIKKEKYDIFYLLVDPTANETLLSWYKQFDMKEIHIEKSIYGTHTTFLYKYNNNIKDENIQQFIKNIKNEFSE